MVKFLCDAYDRQIQSLDWWAGRARTLRRIRPPIRAFYLQVKPSLKTVLVHRFSRKMSGWPSGHAVVSGGVGQAILPHRTETEKFCPLNASITHATVTVPGVAHKGTRKPGFRKHSGDKPFPFLSHFRSDNSL